MWEIEDPWASTFKYSPLPTTLTFNLFQQGSCFSDRWVNLPLLLARLSALPPPPQVLLLHPFFRETAFLCIFPLLSHTVATRHFHSSSCLLWTGCSLQIPSFPHSLPSCSSFCSTESSSLNYLCDFQVTLCSLTFFLQTYFHGSPYLEQPWDCLVQ